MIQELAKLMKLEKGNQWLSNTWHLESGLSEETQDKSKILNGKFFIAFKDEGSNKQKQNARLVVEIYKDSMKKSFNHNTSVSRQETTKLLVGIAAVFGFSLFTTDATQAYLQSTEN